MLLQRGEESSTAPGLQSTQRSCTPHVALVLLGESDKAARDLRLPTLHELQNLGKCVKNFPIHKADDCVTTIKSSSGLILLVGDRYRQIQPYDLVHICLSAVPEKCRKYTPEVVPKAGVSDCLWKKKQRFPWFGLLWDTHSSTYWMDWVQKRISKHRAMQMKCQKDINILRNWESRKDYIYSVEKAVMIAQIYV